MSWAVSVFGGPDSPQLHDAAPGWKPAMMGTGDAVRRCISSHLPGMDWSTPTWGIYAGNGFTFEFIPRKTTNRLG